MFKAVFFSESSKNLVSKLTLVVLILISSCTKEDVKGPGDLTQDNKEVEAIFRSAISNVDGQSTTRASGTIWDSGDEIGIFAFNQSGTPDVYSIYNEKENIKYINNTSGSIAHFQAADETITFPDSNGVLDFVAYYPYSSTGVSAGSEMESELTLNIDISQQFPLSDIDVMYASANGNNSENPNVELIFNHSLSQLTLELTADEIISLEGTGITIHNASTRGNMNLYDGIVTLTETVSGEVITPVSVFNSEKKSITATAILLPGQDLSEIEVKIQTADGVIYKWQPDEYLFQPGVRRNYSLNLKPHSIEIKVTGATISDWLDDTFEQIENISPDGVVVAVGSKSNPYSVEQAIINQGETEVWVEGYIMGWGKGSLNLEVLTTTTELNSNSNIVLADSNSETDISKMIPIRFIMTENEPQKQLNLKENSHLLGRKVKVCCNLSKEFNVAGGNEIIGFEII